MNLTTLIMLAADLVAIGILAFGLFLRRHHRRDLVSAFLGINVGVFSVSAVLASTEVGLGVGLGLFGVLSIIRLRSNEITQREIAYYFASLALGLIAGMPTTVPQIQLGMLLLVLIAMYIGDHPGLGRRSYHQVLVVDRAHVDEQVLRQHIESLYRARVRQLTILQTDFVNDTTRVDVRYTVPKAPKAPKAPRQAAGTRRGAG